MPLFRIKTYSHAFFCSSAWYWISGRFRALKASQGFQLLFLARLVQLWELNVQQVLHFDTLYLFSVIIPRTVMCFRTGFSIKFTSFTLIQRGTRYYLISTALILFQICCFAFLIYSSLPHARGSLSWSIFSSVPNTSLTLSIGVSFPTKFLPHVSQISVSTLKGPDTFLSGIKTYYKSSYKVSEMKPVSETELLKMQY